jgi:hypothetical protein
VEGMQELKGKILPLTLIIFLVIIILVSNLGQDFKDDIFSYNNTLNYSNNYIKYWNESKQYQQYIDTSSDYIVNLLKRNEIQPLLSGKYIQEWSDNLPAFNTPSSLEVLSRYGRIIKRYEYGSDFFEDFKGITRADEVWGKAGYIQSIDDNNKNSLKKILLYTGYKIKSDSEIKYLDSQLKNSGVSAVISPAGSGYLKSDSGLYDNNFYSLNDGIAKLIVTPPVFEELRDFTVKGYNIRVKTGASVKQTRLKNVYGVLQGRNKAYKPLVIAVFYDGIYKTRDTEVNDFEKYSITPSILSDCIRTLKLQRSLVPDRTIIFAFLSGYSQDKEGLRLFMDNKFSGEYIVMDGLGTGNKNMLSYNKSSRNFSASIESLLKKNDLEILSKSINMDVSPVIVNVTTINFEKNARQDFQTIQKSGKFLLSLIGDECYNLDFLSGNIRELRMFKRFVRDYTPVISLITLVLLIFVIFKSPPPKTN